MNICCLFVRIGWSIVCSLCMIVFEWQHVATVFGVVLHLPIPRLSSLHALLVSMQCNTTSQSIWYGSRLYPHRQGNVCTKVVVETNGIVTTKTIIQEDPTCASGTTWDAKSGKCKYCESGYTYRCVRVRSEGVVAACGLMCVLVFLCSRQG